MRIVYTDTPERAMPEHRGKVFALIGPFESFSDQPELRQELEQVLQTYNKLAPFLHTD
jgi:hypothetical protein